jgi:glycosyltransferase involved in cell wall biosynthesis
VDTAVIVSTFNAPESLRLSLLGFAAQQRSEFEVVVADDGSGPETREVVAGWAPEFGGCLQHVWHENQGNRKSIICNEAVRVSKAPYLVFLDGDAVPHSRWLEDHIEIARPGRVLCGRRVKLGPNLSGRIGREEVESGSLERWFGIVFRGAIKRDVNRWMLGLRVPSFARGVFHPTRRKLMGVNFSLPRSVFEAVNGYDEEWTSRRQDRDLDLRLTRGAFESLPLINRAVVYHLHHEERRPDPATQERVRAEEESSRVRCAVGLVRDPR